MNVVIIKYNAGNTKSVQFALERIGVKAIVSDDIETIQNGDKIIFPGVGEASSAMKYLHEKNLAEVIKNLTQPVFGICLGMQLMCKHSEEGNTKCLGIFDAAVKKFKATDNEKIPHTGWNTIHGFKGDLFKQVDENSYCYFVHSYYAATVKETIATTNHIQPFSAALQKNNFYGVQFHPERSGIVGEQILKNFIEL